MTRRKPRSKNGDIGNNSAVYAEPRMTASNLVNKRNPQVRNRILRSLRPQEYERLMSSSELVTLNSGDVLFEAGCRISELYFIDTGMASLLSSTEAGNTIEVGMVGHEGFVGSALVLKNSQMPYRSMMQLSLIHI